ncbi:ribonuclease H-like domain-containing protein [Xylaria venustula]|nr:ribonuclease H-like domain-containing protein [Xylaria venustula]
MMRAIYGGAITPGLTYKRVQCPTPKIVRSSIRLNYVPIRTSTKAITTMAPLGLPRSAPRQASFLGVLDGSLDEALAAPSVSEDQSELIKLVDTVEDIASMMDKLAKLPLAPPELHVDLEGVNLSRHGTLSLVQIHLRTTGETFIVDITTLGKVAFSTRGKRTRHTLKSIFESNTIWKVFFDVRSDSDILFSHYKVKLRHVYDLQLMELATRSHGKTFLGGLKGCIENDLSLTDVEKANFVKKVEAIRLFNPKHGGSYEVFNQRPLLEVIRNYCVQDVKYLPRLWDLYSAKLKKASKWKLKVKRETSRRLGYSRSKDFEPNSSSMMNTPKGW